MDADFDSPVNIERPPPPLTFSPDSRETALPSSPPPTTMPLPPLDSTNHQHNSSQHLSQPSFQLQQVQQVDEAPAPATATATDTTAPDRPTPSNSNSNNTEPTPQLDGTSSGGINTTAEAPADDSAMDTTPDDNNNPMGSTDTPAIANADPSEQTSTSDSQPQHSSTDNTAPNPTTDNTSGTVDSSAPADSGQRPSDGWDNPPPQSTSWNQEQAEATNADVDEYEQDDSSSDVSDDQGNEKPPEEHAYWADIEEDISTPNEEELKEIIENAERETSSAIECEFSFLGQYLPKNIHLTSVTLDDYWEKSFFRDLDDPEYQPCEKARVSWKFKGVRGTKENPNRANIMRSPAAYVGGYYWTVKFFPRGNSVSALSVYVECSRTPPQPVPELSELEFKVLTGAPDAVLSDLTPDLHILPKTTDSGSPQPDTNQPEAENTDQPKPDQPTSSPTSPVAEPAAPAETPIIEGADKEGNWRVSAQIGVTVYNPNEPRTSWMQSSSHQFNPHNPDWGWTNFHGPWDQIHKRQRGQRQALLRNDTLAFDAYIRIFKDPTQSLWWHSSDAESAWNSYAITGYAPIGDPDLNYRAEIAALISWCHLAPFREIVEKIDVFANLGNSNIRARTLSFGLKQLLYYLEKERRANGNANPDLVIRELQTLNELSGNVVDFWERLRRSLEIEVADTSVSQQLSKIFDSQKPAVDSQDSSAVNYLPTDFNSTVRVSAKNAGSVQSAVSKYLEQEPGKWALPEILNVELDRQEFDKKSGRWAANFEKVTLDEKLALESSAVDGQGGYSLYGFVVHNGKRTSGKFYSILRPGGPGCKWLAFQDGRPNKVECLTTKAALEGHCGLDPAKAKDINETSNYDVAVVVMYVRDDVLKNYLGLELRPIDLPNYHSCYHSHDVDPAEDDIPPNEESNIQVEVYSSSTFDSVNPLFDEYDLMACARSNGSVRSLSVPAGTTYKELREKLVLSECPDNRDKIDRTRLWYLVRAPDQGWLVEDGLVRIGDIFTPINLIFPGDTVRLWMDVVSEDEAHLFSYPNRDVSSYVFERAPEELPPPPEPPLAEAVVVEEGEANGEETGSGNTETVPPERPETPRASDSELRPEVDGDVPMADGDADETAIHGSVVTDQNREEGEVPAAETAAEPPAELVAETPAETAAEPSAEPIAEPEPVASSPAPEEQQTNDDVPMEDAVDNDAAIAAVIANDLEEFENSQAMDAEPTPPPEIPAIPVPEPLSVPQLSEPSQPPQPEEPVPEEPTEPGYLTVNPYDTAMDQTDDSVPQSQTINANPGEEQQPEGVVFGVEVVNGALPSNPDPPVSHIYYFLQIFDANKQELRFAGRYFARSEDNVKDVLSRALKWPEDKSFSVWSRLQNEVRPIIDQSVNIRKAAKGDDGCCFVVGEKLPKAEYVDPCHIDDVCCC